ncbi:MAG: carboxylating nicotinate-nucleotide diphosphorylase [Lentisphaerae bacterium]|nr:carboxylating nicotinate-nucleotide diphosphorylase [Lentisphaerota bacterium]
MAARPEVIELVRRALAEDIGPGDVTTDSLVPPASTIQAVILARDPCVVSGLDLAATVFKAVDAGIDCAPCVRDGDRVSADAVLVTLRGPARGILTAERTALNFLQRLTGIATLTARFVDKVKAHGVTILDTRKTTPTLRILEKYAVTCGGGENHREGLYDRVLIKDNHRKLWADAGEGNLAEAVRKARSASQGILVEVEVETEQELTAVLEAVPDWVLLDNMSPDRLQRCVQLCAGRCQTEASGGIGLDNIEEIARTGVDAVSLGCLTHSAPAADLSLEVLDCDPACNAVDG